MSSVPITQLVATNGVDPHQSWGDSAAHVVGLVHSFAGDYPANGAAPANGQAIAADAHPGLCKVIGSPDTFGGNGDAFALPDLRGRAVIGTSWRGDRRIGAIGHDGRTVTLNWIIATYGLFPTGAAAPAMGHIRPFLGSEAPSGWALCHGQYIHLQSNQALFAVLGTAFGGNEHTMFQLPNLSGRTPVGIKPGEIALGQLIEIDGIPALGMNMLVAARGYQPKRDGDGWFPDEEAMAGDVVLAASTMPRMTEDGMVAADGCTLPIAEHRALFAAVGTRWGGDGVATVGVPDLRGKILVGA
jgi:microcystin-dependent protein